MDYKHVIGFIMAFSVLLAACTQQITVSPQPEQHTLSVSGQGQLDVNPDKAEVTFSVVTNASTAQEAQSLNRERSNAIIKTLTGQGLKEEDLESIDYDLHRLYGWREKTGERTDLGYEVVHRVKATTTQLERVGPLVDLGVSSGANQVDSISFGLTRMLEQQAKSEALTKASQEASSKAQGIAATLRINLGKITRASESASYIPYYPPYAGRALEADYLSKAAEPTIINPKKLTVQASVSLEYEIV